jgi:hypothetical protein
MPKKDTEPLEPKLEILDDPIVKVLLENSALTQIQLETLLLNFHLDDLQGKSVKYADKSRLRQFRSQTGVNPPRSKHGVSRGAFRRVLGQAGTNIIKSIYTLMLLAYTGLMQSPSLQPYVQLSDMIESYLQEIQQVPRIKKKKEVRQHLRILEKRLLEMIDEYTEPFQLSGRH